MENKKSRIITLGEIMLRLKSPGYERLCQSGSLEATFAGGEANVAVSLANYEEDVSFVTALPDNAVADACIAFLRCLGVDTSMIVRSGDRIGVYYLEAGSNQRPSIVIYDRAHSAIANANSDQFDWDRTFDGAKWFHITGITPAISQQAADIALTAVKYAKAKGVTISCDYNYRKNLWNYGKNPIEVMRELVKYVDVGIANEEDCQLALGIEVDRKSWNNDISSGEINLEKYEALCKKVLEKFPNLKMQAITLRHSYSANHNGWSGCLYDGKNFYVGPYYDITDIVDRVGAGDSFCGGLIHKLINGSEHKDALDFAVAASCLKHTIYGDFNRVSKKEVYRLLSGDKSGRVRR